MDDLPLLPLREPWINGCQTLVRYIQLRGSLKPRVRELIELDFWWQVHKVAQADARPFVLEMLRMKAPKGVQANVLAAFNRTEDGNEMYFDIAIVTVIQEELLAAKIVFGIADAKADRRIDGFQYWFAAITTEEGDSLRVVITMIGESGPKPCFNACERLFAGFGIGLCILCGIAAGVKEKLKLGDVLMAKAVLDYESARLEPGGPEKRPQQAVLDKLIYRDLLYFDPGQGWHVLLDKCLEDLRTRRPEVPIEGEWRPSCRLGVLLSGEKLVADGSLPAMRKEYHEEGVALEMEGSGFASCCREHTVPWLIFRGISDHGDPEKSALGRWQAPAALAAATLIRTFLTTSYHPLGR